MSKEGKKEDVPEVPTPTPEQLKKQQLSQEVYDQVAVEQMEENKRAGLPSQVMLGGMAKFAEYCVQTGQMPKTIDTAAKAIMVFQAGRELGVPPIKSLQSFYFVNNKLSMYGATVIERIRKWAKIEYGECDATSATVTITRKDDGTKLASTVTMSDLKERGIVGEKDTFKKHPRTMLIYKAVGEIVRHIVPEAVGAMAVEGDYGDDAESEINNKVERKGKVTDVEPKDEVDVSPLFDQGEVPSADYIFNHYDLNTIKTKLIELGVEFKKETKKRELSALLSEALKKQNHG